MSLCLIIQQSGTIIMGADTATSIVDKNTVVRCNNSAQKIYHIGNEVVFCSGQLDYSDIVIRSLKMKDDRIDTEFLCKLLQMLVPENERVRELDGEHFPHIEVLIGGVKGGIAYMHQISEYEDFKVQTHIIPDGYTKIWAAGIHSRECMDIATNEFVQSGHNVTVTYTNTYKKMVCPAIGGFIDAYMITPGNVSHIINHYDLQDGYCLAVVKPGKLHNIIADTIIGKFMASQSLIIENSDSTVYIDGKGITIKNGLIQSANYMAGEAGSKLDLTNGSFDFGGGRLTWNGEILNISGSGSFTGDVTANNIIAKTSGNIANFTLSGSDLYSGDSGMSSDTGKYAFWAGETNGSHGAGNTDAKFKVGHNGVMTATGADITGKITATSGSIAGYIITGNLLKGKKVGISGDNTQEYAFWAGSDTAASAPFRVMHNGNFVADNANLTGSLTSTDEYYKTVIDAGRINLERGGRQISLDGGGISFYLGGYNNPTTISAESIYSYSINGNGLSINGNIDCTGTITLAHGQALCGTTNVDNVFSLLTLERRDDGNTADGLVNCTRLGHKSLRTYIYTSSTGQKVYSNGAWNQFSDRRLKENFQPLDERYLDMFDNLNPTLYNWKSDLNGRKDVGYVAQDVIKAMELAGISEDENSIVNVTWEENTQETYSLTYEGLDVISTYALQDARKRIAELERKVQLLEMIADLKY